MNKETTYEVVELTFRVDADGENANQVSGDREWSTTDYDEATQGLPSCEHASKWEDSYFYEDQNDELVYITIYRYI